MFLMAVVCSMRQRTSKALKKRGGTIEKGLLTSSIDNLYATH